MVKSLLPLIFIFYQLNTAIAQDQDDVLAKAIAQYSLEDYTGAIQTLDSVAKINPRSKEAIYYRMLCWFKLADYDKLQNDYYSNRKFVPSPVRKYLKLYCDTAYQLKYLKHNFYKYDKLLPEKGYRPLYTRKDTLRGSLSELRSCFDVTFYNLSVKIDQKKKRISGSNKITFKVIQSTNRIQIDLFDNYSISSIVWNSKQLKYSRELNAIFIDFPEVLKVGSSETIEISYSGKPRVAPRPPWDGGFVWDKDKRKNYWSSVACEYLGASSWWPCKDHLSDEPDSMLMTYTVPRGYDVVSNGVLRKISYTDSLTSSYTWFVSYPLNNYNATFYMGKFSHFSDTMTNKSGKYALDYYVLPPNLTKARQHFQQTRKVLSTYEELFGDYPFMRDGFAFVESPYQGMEHQGAIAYGNDYDNTSHGQVYVNKKEDMIIVHESAHEWWGNSVTVKDMADIWLQEGFATFAENLYFEKQYGYTEYLREIGNSMSQIFNFWPLIQNYGVNEYAFASNDCYRKGSAVLQCLRSEINNDSVFFRILKEFATRFKYKTVSNSDFVSLVTEITKTDFTAFFNKFLYDKRLPVLEFTIVKNGQNSDFSFRWTEVENSFKMPFCITDGTKYYRLEGTTNWQTLSIPAGKTVRFITPFVTPEKAEKNSLTSYWTNWKR